MLINTGYAMDALCNLESGRSQPLGETAFVGQVATEVASLTIVSLKTEVTRWDTAWNQLPRIAWNRNRTTRTLRPVTAGACPCQRRRNYEKKAIAD